MKHWIVAAALCCAGLAQAQPASQPETGLVVGSGNYFSPIVRDLDRAIAFYRDGLGLEVQGPPGDAAANPALRNMFGLPDAKIRWAIARTPAAPGGVEMVEISGAGGRLVERQLADPGAMCLVVTVRDLDATLARLKNLGAPVVSKGGAPVTIGGGTRIVVVQDPDGHFVELSQPAEAPSASVPATANVVGVRLRLAVDDVETAARLYRDELGLPARAPIGDFGDNANVLAALGLTSGQYRVALQSVPASGLMFDFVDFKNVERKATRARIQDFGSTRVQLRVRDIDAAIAAFKRFGGEVVSTGGAPLALPAGSSTLRVAIVRDPNDLFAVLIEAPPAPAAAAPVPTPAAAQAAAAERQRQQDATPDTRGSGRYPALKETDARLPEHVIYRPADLRALGTTKLGIYAFGNGGCTDDGASARLHLLEIASHGYLALAPGRIYNGPGKLSRPPRAPVANPADAPPVTHAEQLRQAIDWAIAENGREGSPYFGRIDAGAIAISGFSCGGIQALVNAKDPRVATAVIMNSGLFKEGPTRMAGMELTKSLLADLHFPTLYILGGPTDIAYANGMDDYAKIAHVPVAVANIDKGHGGTYWEPNGGAAAQVVVRWLDWRLRGNAAAGKSFLGASCELCTDPAWQFESKGLDALK